MRQLGKAAAPIALALLSVAFLLGSRGVDAAEGFVRSGRFLPVLAAGGLLVVVLLDLVGHRRAHVDRVPLIEDDSQDDGGPLERRDRMRLLAVSLLLVAFGYAAPWTGYALALAALVFATGIATMGWAHARRVLLFAVVASLALIVLFQHLLGVTLPAGLVGWS